MTKDEIINKRETLVAEQRKLRQGIKILQSGTFISTPGIQKTIEEYNLRIERIDEEIKKLAEDYQALMQAQVQSENEKTDHTDHTEWTIMFDFDGDKVYPTDCVVRFRTHPDRDEVLKWKNKHEAFEFGRWYSGKYGFKIVPLDKVE